jgi:hypothetical protein
VGAASVRVGLAGVEVSKEDGSVRGIPLVFVHLSHNEVM